MYIYRLGSILLIRQVDVGDWKLTVRVTFVNPEESGKGRRRRERRNQDGADTRILWHTVLSGERTDLPLVDLEAPEWVEEDLAIVEARLAVLEGTTRPHSSAP